AFDFGFDHAVSSHVACFLRRFDRAGRFPVGPEPDMSLLSDDEPERNLLAEAFPLDEEFLPAQRVLRRNDLRYNRRLVNTCDTQG
ncbi:hypothetical protein ACTXQV_68700, partial [Klebsiella pneumoniae]